MPMKPKHLMFVTHYLSNGQNGTQAAISAGFSAHTAATQGSRILKRVDVQAEIASRLAKLEKKLDISPERILKEYASIAFTNLQDCYDNEGNPLPINKLPREVAAALTSIENDKGFITYKQTSKMTALEFLAKYQRMIQTEQQNAQVAVVILSKHGQLSSFGATELNALPVIDQVALPAPDSLPDSPSF